MSEKVKELIRQRFVKNSIWLLAMQLANTLLPLITVPYVTRVLGAAGYGQFSLACNWITYCQVLVEYGFLMNGARSVALHPRDPIWVSGLFSRILTARMLLFLAALAGLTGLVFFRNPAMLPPALMLMLSVLPVVFRTDWLFQGMQEMKYLTLTGVLGRLISAVLILTLVRREQQVLLYCLCYSASYLISGFLGLWIACRKYRLRFRLPGPSSVLRQLREGWHLFTSSALSQLLGGVGITVLGFSATVEAVGGYSAVCKFSLVLGMFFSPIGQALYPHMSALWQQDRGRAAETLQKLFRLIFPLFTLAGVGILILRRPLIALLLGREYLPFGALLWLLIPQALLGILNYFLGVLGLIARGLQKPYSRCIALSMAVLTGTSLLLCPLWGAMGTAAAALAAELVLTAALSLCLFRIHVASRRKS